MNVKREKLCERQGTDLKKQRIVSIIITLFLFVFLTACGAQKTADGGIGGTGGIGNASYESGITEDQDTDGSSPENIFFEGEEKTGETSAEQEFLDSTKKQDPLGEDPSSEIPEAGGSQEAGPDGGASEDLTADGSLDAENIAGQYDLPEYGEYYYDLENVVLYLEIYDELPQNYITKKEAEALGWEGGSVEKYKEGAAIGGDTFGNREGLLPEEKGRRYTECDIDTDGYGSRGSRRLVFSNDGLYFYTSDHYESFSKVFVTEEYEVILTTEE